MPSSRGSSDPRITPMSLMSPALASGFFPSSTTREEVCDIYIYIYTHTHTQYLFVTGVCILGFKPAPLSHTVGETPLVGCLLQQSGSAHLPISCLKQPALLSLLLVSQLTDLVWKFQPQSVASFNNTLLYLAYCEFQSRHEVVILTPWIVSCFKIHVIILLPEAKKLKLGVRWNVLCLSQFTGTRFRVFNLAPFSFTSELINS